MESKSLTCFVMCPFSEPFNEYYKEIYTPALKNAGIEAMRADEIFGVGSIAQDVYDNIVNSDVVLAELTGRNPNVFYELGIAHSHEKPVIMLTQNSDDIPFDVGHLRTIVYDTKGASWGKQLKTNIAKTARELVKKIEENDVISVFSLKNSEKSNKPLGLIKFTNSSSDRIFDYKNCLMQGRGDFFISGTSLLHISEDSSDILLDKIESGSNIKILAMDPSWIRDQWKVLTFLANDEDKKKFYLEIENSLSKISDVANRAKRYGDGRIELKLYSTFFPYIVTGYMDFEDRAGQLVVEITDYLPEKNRPRIVAVNRHNNCPYSFVQQKFESLWNSKLSKRVGS